MYELAHFDLVKMVQCGAALRGMSDGCTSMDQVAERVVSYLRDCLVDADGKPACALARFYKTQCYGTLPSELKDFAAGILAGSGTTSWDEMKCLTLLATRGDDPAWCTRSGSSGHKAIPLPSEDFVAKIPMIRALVAQLGLDVKSVVAPEATLLLDIEQKTFNVFHVETAAGSSFIPAQDFVVQHGVRSVLGFGGMLATGDLFTVILFSKVAISREIAELFATLALSVKMAIHPFLHRPVFAQVAEASE